MNMCISYIITGLSSLKQSSRQCTINFFKSLLSDENWLLEYRHRVTTVPCKIGNMVGFMGKIRRWIKRHSRRELAIAMPLQLPRRGIFFDARAPGAIFFLYQLSSSTLTDFSEWQYRASDALRAKDQRSISRILLLQRSHNALTSELFFLKLWRHDYIAS